MASDPIHNKYRQAIHEVLKPKGFKKIASTWYLHTPETILIVNFQTGIGGSHYLNASVYIRCLPPVTLVTVPEWPHEYECHMRARAEEVMLRKEAIEIFEIYNCTEKESIQRLKNALTEHVLPSLYELKTAEAIKTVLRSPSDLDGYKLKNGARFNTILHGARLEFFLNVKNPAPFQYTFPTFLTYSTHADGFQAVYMRDKKKLIKELDTFFEEFATLVDDSEAVQFHIVETDKDTNGQSTKPLCKRAIALFGEPKFISKGPLRSQLNWQLPFSMLEQCIDFLEAEKPFPKYANTAHGQEYTRDCVSWITCYLNFRWKHLSPISNVLKPFDFIEESGIILLLENTNSIDLQLNFPFETPNKEFLQMIEKISALLHVKMPSRYFRLRSPNKERTRYREEKITF